MAIEILFCMCYHICMSYLIMLFCGILSALPFVFTDLWLLAWVCIAPLFWFAAEKKHAYRHGLAFFIGFYGVIYHWFTYLYPMEFAGFDNIQSVAVIAVCWLGMIILQGPVFALVAPIYRRLHTGKTYIDPFIAASLWVIFEWLQTQTWMGVPWARMAVSQYRFLPVIQSSSLLGSLFVSFLIALSNGYAAIALRHILGGEKDKKNGVPSATEGSADADTQTRTDRRTAVVSLITAGAILTANTVYGIAALAMYNDEDSVGITAAVIQGNIASGDKWKDGSVYTALDTYFDLTVSACIKYSPQIVLWPETAINVPLRLIKGMSDRISQLAQTTGAVILVGAFDYVDDPESGETQSYNAIVAFYPDGSIGESPYYKRHLVPFGEYLPMPWFFKTFLPMLAEMNLFKSDLTPGDSSNLINTAYGKLGGLVCFDSIYGELVRESVVDGANLIILSTNDSWYRDSSAVYQHNGHAVLRAIENGRYVVRAANTGVSSAISPTGQMLTMLGPLIKDYTAAEVKMRSERTLYSYVGDAWIAACAVFVAGIGVYKAVKYPRKKSKADM